MNGRKWVRLPIVFGLVMALASSAAMQVQAQSTAPTPTGEIAACVDNAADRFVECVEESNMVGDVLCALAYAADAVLCIPSRILKLV